MMGGVRSRKRVGEEGVRKGAMEFRREPSDRYAAGRAS